MVEVLLVNIYLIALKSMPTLKTKEFRWALLLQLKAKADALDADTVQKAVPIINVDAGGAVGRWNGGLLQHHHDFVADYINP